MSTLNSTKRVLAFQRTRDTPPSMQFENVAPYEYFRRLVARFETTMLAYRRQIDETEAYLESLTHKRQRLEKKCR